MTHLARTEDGHLGLIDTYWSHLMLDHCHEVDPCPWPYCTDAGNTTPAGCTAIPSPLLCTFPAVNFDPLATDQATYLENINFASTTWTAYRLPAIAQALAIEFIGGFDPNSWLGETEDWAFETRTFEIMSDDSGWPTVVHRTPATCQASDILSDSGWQAATIDLTTRVTFYGDPDCVWKLDHLKFDSLHPFSVVDAEKEYLGTVLGNYPSSYAWAGAPYPWDFTAAAWAEAQAVNPFAVTPVIS